VGVDRVWLAPVEVTARHTGDVDRGPGKVTRVSEAATARAAPT
jgi:hypothetical protein